MKGTGLLLGCLLFACSGPEKDKDIRQMIASTAKKDVVFAGVNFVVKNGVVTLNGKALSETDRQKVESTVKEVSGVKDVINQIQITPGVFGGDQPLKQSVDSVLQKYPTVIAVIKDSVIVLQGTVNSKKAQKLFKAIQSLSPKGLANELVISDQAEQETGKGMNKKDKE